MERKMLNIKLQDRLRNEEIHRRSKVTDTLGYIAKIKCKWAGHVARLQGNRWTIRCTEWSPRGKNRGRPAKPGEMMWLVNLGSVG